MTTQPADLENSIRIALEAAETANESAEEVSRLGAAAQQSANKLDAFARVIKPVAIGCLAGALISTALGGLVYLRTLSEMRTATATQIEALAVFSTSLEELREEIDGMSASSEMLAGYTDTQESRHAELLTAIDGIETGTMAEPASVELPADVQALPQLLRGVTDAIEEAHVETRDQFTAGLSDLQLSMARMLADELAPEPPKPAAEKTTATRPAPRPAPRAAPARARQSKPAANPFKFP